MYLELEESGLIVGTQKWEERQKKRSGLREQVPEQIGNNSINYNTKGNIDANNIL
ncbi:hypothetical protein [Eisenbergiella tayi]|uniref:hypothetical protein n=1 Tax=Eisenbergiella tayi TaxID=1432052 RepID=UPI00307B8739